MVVGNGLIANAFSSYKELDEFVIFASGVSNSKTSTEDDFRREYNLLMSVLKNNNRKLVYFSTCSIDDPDLHHTSYVKHKVKMEEVVKRNAASYSIFRLSNLAGVSNNPNTILNFFYLHVSNQKSFELWKNSERNIIDVHEVYYTADYILQNKLFTNKTVNIANQKNYPVRYIIHCIEAFTQRKAIFIEKEKGNKIEIDISEVKPVFEMLGITFGNDYLPHLLEKYYSKK